MNDYIIAPSTIAWELDKAERESIAAYNLLNIIIEPAFQCYRCDGILKDYAQRETNGDLDKAARVWMEENFDNLYAACYACLQLLDSVSTTLVDLPKPKEPEAGKTSERGS